MGKRYYGIHIDHDAAIAIYNEDGELEFHSQAERVCRKRHARPGINLEDLGGFPPPKEGDVIAISAVSPSKFKLWKANHVYDPIVEMYYEPDTPKATDYNKWMLGSFPTPKYNLHHHLCHIAASWAYREDDTEKFCMAYDGAGTDAKGDTTCYLGGYISNAGFTREDINPIPSSNVVHRILGGDASAGKAMGAVGYFQPDDNLTPHDIIQLIENSCGKNTRFEGGPPIMYPPHSQEDLIFAAKLYKFWMGHTWLALEANILKYRKPNQGVLIGGGTALALELNTRIFNMCNNVTFCPAADDSGQALGAATYCYFLETGKWPKPLRTAALQHVHKPNPPLGPQDPARIARLIANGKVVGLLRGDAEIGPRALGYRSLLARADKDFNLPRVSQHIKGREFYRPLAPMVTSDAFDRYFIGPKGKYMQYMVHCNDFCQKELPAIVHRDLTSRPQVVYAQDDPWLYTMLQEYEALTGHPVLINTSLNGKGKPICNTLQDAQEDMKGKSVDLISIA